MFYVCLEFYLICLIYLAFVEKVSEYGQEIPQLHNADQPMAREKESQNIYSNKTSVRQYKQSNQLSLPLQDDCKTRKDTK